MVGTKQNVMSVLCFFALCNVEIYFSVKKEIIISYLV